MRECYSEFTEDSSKEGIEIPSFNEFLIMLRLKNISYSTVWRWMIHLGYKYDINKKSYYTDGHNRVDVVEYCDKIFNQQYCKYELRSYRWIQIEDTKAKKIEEENRQFPKNCYYTYTKDQTLMREYHIDTHPLLPTLLSQPDDAKGGCLSVRFPAAKKTIMLIGQDESTFHKLVFSCRGWKTSMSHSFI